MTLTLVVLCFILLAVGNLVALVRISRVERAIRNAATVQRFMGMFEP